MGENIRNRQDSNLRSLRESDFESDALTTRPQLLLSFIEVNFVLILLLEICKKALSSGFDQARSLKRTICSFMQVKTDFYQKR